MDRWIVVAHTIRNSTLAQTDLFGVIFLAILWQKKVEGNDYQVRSAGNTLRLYTNGVFHSQYNPTRIFGGGLWDLLSMPALLQAQPAAARVLVLGVGGGAVVRQLENLLDKPRIIGVDLDKTHLYVARRWFRVKLSRRHLIHDDAVNWLANYSGPAFDLIVDDLFVGVDGEPHRAVSLDREWSSLLVQHVKPSGMLVVNQGDVKEARQSSLRRVPAIASTIAFEHDCYHNCITAHARTSCQPSDFRKAVQSHPELAAQDRRYAAMVSCRYLR